MAVDSLLEALSKRLPDYELIRDTIAGSRVVKAKGVKYLPHPDPLDASKAGLLRYAAYSERAVFYPATGRTLKGLVGLVFDKDPAIEAPPLLVPVIADASGNGVSVEQQAMAVLSDVSSIGRAGLFVDYPRTTGPTTVLQARAGNVRPTILFIKAERVINWRVETFGAKQMLTLVVIREEYVQSDDGFVETLATRHRVLRLKDGIYNVELWTGNDAADESWAPTDGAGRPFAEIPFVFVGAENNEPGVDDPPLLDLAELNRHHFMNSADYEESVFLVGQPTPVFSGLTKQWVDDVFREEEDDGHGSKRVVNKVRLGARTAIPLPEGGSAELLQAQPNTMAFEAMEHKEKQMLGIGAKLIENSGTQQTATEATIDAVLDNSVLATAARNVSAGYVSALRWAFQFMTGQVVEDENVIDYELQTDFAGKLLNAQDRQQIMTMWQGKAITYTEMRWNMRRTGYAYLSDKEAQAESDAEREASIEFEAAAAGALAEATGAPPVDPETGARPVDPNAPAAKPKPKLKAK